MYVYLCSTYFLKLIDIMYAVDAVSLSESGYSVEQGSGEVVITINRTGSLLDDIAVLFVAGEIPGVANPARGAQVYSPYV